MYKILTDHDIQQSAAMTTIIDAVERCFEEKANGTLAAPPRFRVESEQGDLVFTAGAATGIEKVIGFRVYDTYSNDLAGHEQVVCVFDSDTGVFKGIVIGNLLGAIRTGAIGGVAIRAMARIDAEEVAVIGTGLQARTQLQAAVASRNIKLIKVYSRNPVNRTKFAEEMTEKLQRDISVTDSAEECVKGADILISATNSAVPVFETDWIRPGAHINTVGPKSAKRHEVPIDLAACSSVIATDSIAQLRSYSTPHFLVGTSDEDRVIELSDIVSKTVSGRTSSNDITLFCSVGLAGTEVVVANEILNHGQNGITFG